MLTFLIFRLISPRYPEEKDGNGRTLYGGVRDGNIVGGTKVGFDSKLISSLVFHLNSGVSWSRLQEHSHRDDQHRCPREGGGSRGDKYNQCNIMDCLWIDCSDKNNFSYSFPRWNMQGSKGFL